jgi:hypothetical protein
VLAEPGQEDLADFLANHKVRVVASLPCYSAKNVNLQRGSGVFDRSIRALLELNQRGYGQGGDLKLDLVYNPLGPFLPPAQGPLEKKYKVEMQRMLFILFVYLFCGGLLFDKDLDMTFNYVCAQEELLENFGIVFNSLFTITNMPIRRFADALYRQGALQDYMNLLVNSFNPHAVDGVMCRNHVNVAYDGTIYDCDFNQQLALGLYGDASATSGNDNSFSTKGSRVTVFDIENTNDLMKWKINTDRHCFGCTAGFGSSCQGTTTTDKA